MTSSYIITVDDTTPVPTITVDATGVLHRDGMVYLDPIIQKRLLDLIDALTDVSSVIVWENAQPDWRETARLQ